MLLKSLLRVVTGVSFVISILAVNSVYGSEGIPSYCSSPVLVSGQDRIMYFFQGSVEDTLLRLGEMGGANGHIARRLSVLKTRPSLVTVKDILRGQLEGFQKYWPTYLSKITPELRSHRHLKELLMLSIIIREVGAEDVFRREFQLSENDYKILNLRGKSGLLTKHLTRREIAKALIIEIEKDSKSAGISNLDLLYTYEIFFASKEAMYEENRSLLVVDANGVLQIKSPKLREIESTLQTKKNLPEALSKEQHTYTFPSVAEKRQFLESYAILKKASEQIHGLHTLTVNDAPGAKIGAISGNGIRINSFLSTNQSDEIKRRVTVRLAKVMFDLEKFLRTQGYRVKAAQGFHIGNGIIIPAIEFFIPWDGQQWLGSYFRPEDIVVDPQTLELTVIHLHTYRSSDLSKLSLQSSFILSRPVPGHPGLRVTAKSFERDFAQALRFADKWHSTTGGVLVLIPQYMKTVIPFADGIIFDKKGIALFLYTQKTTPTNQSRLADFQEKVKQKHTLFEQFRDDPARILERPLGLESFGFLVIINNFFEMISLNLPQKYDPIKVHVGDLSEYREFIRFEQANIPPTTKVKRTKQFLDLENFEKAYHELLPQLPENTDIDSIAHVIQKIKFETPSVEQMKIPFNILMNSIAGLFSDEHDLIKIASIRDRWLKLAKSNRDGAYVFLWNAAQTAKTHRIHSLPKIESILEKLERIEPPYILRRDPFGELHQLERVRAAMDTFKTSQRALNLENLDAEFDLLTRQTLRARRGDSGFVLETDLAMQPEMMGFPDRMIQVTDGKLDFLFSFAGEKVFAVGPEGALSFKRHQLRSFSTRDNAHEIIKFFGVLMPKGFVNYHGFDSLQLKSRDVYSLSQALREVPSGAGSGPEKIFMINHENSTRDRGQVHIPFSRRVQLPSGEVVTLIEYLRRHALGVVEFDQAGRILRVQWKE